ncbi:hypothetical protein B0A48_07312 [Cryoendolithus antarcticus]|uniref:BZIP domain-containing protein n=1 Tax=Cryoendolithus antarcticus TaxID=1507870 RepID=A0A1V8T892_9PEZI|nr:hypothetical protein B0A48_07312 [Cryoendolithus antarcticus]
MRPGNSFPFLLSGTLVRPCFLDILAKRSLRRGAKTIAVRCAARRINEPGRSHDLMSHVQVDAPLSTSPDDWSVVTDANERRKIQNRIAQRKFRDKARQQQEEAIRSADNQAKAAGSYTPVEPDDVDTGDEEGLPWGSLSLRHIIATGRAKEQSSRETSVYAAASRAGGSSRLGLHLVDQYARSTPAWTFWRTGNQWPAVPASVQLPSQREPIAQLAAQPGGAGVTRHEMG